MTRKASILLLVGLLASVATVGWFFRPADLFNGSTASSGKDSSHGGGSEPALRTMRVGLKPTSQFPLVTITMPTTARRSMFWNHAFDSARNQDYPNLEMVVVADEGDEVPVPSGDESWIRVLFAAKNTTIGAKRQKAVDAARGEIIAHWDDDDLYTKDRITASVRPLLEHKADFSVMHGPQLLHARSGSVYDGGDLGYVVGLSLTYRKNREDKCRYPDQSLDEDANLMLCLFWHGNQGYAIKGDSAVIVRHMNTWSISSQTGAALQRVSPRDSHVSSEELRFFKETQALQSEQRDRTMEIERKAERPYRHIPGGIYLWWNSAYRHLFPHQGPFPRVEHNHRMTRLLLHMLSRPPSFDHEYQENSRISVESGGYAAAEQAQAVLALRETRWVSATQRRMGAMHHSMSAGSGVGTGMGDVGTGSGGVGTGSGDASGSTGGNQAKSRPIHTMAKRFIHTVDKTHLMDHSIGTGGNSGSIGSGSGLGSGSESGVGTGSGSFHSHSKAPRTMTKRFIRTVDSIHMMAEHTATGGASGMGAGTGAGTGSGGVGTGAGTGSAGTHSHSRPMRTMRRRVIHTKDGVYTMAEHHSTETGVGTGTAAPGTGTAAAGTGTAQGTAQGTAGRRLLSVEDIEEMIVCSAEYTGQDTACADVPEGQACEPGCLPGYDRVGGAPSLLCSSTGFVSSKKLLGPLLPYCAPKSCHVEVPHAAKSSSSCHDVLSGNTCTLTCEPGFVPSTTGPVKCAHGQLHADAELRCTQQDGLAGSPKFLMIGSRKERLTVSDNDGFVVHRSASPRLFADLWQPVDDSEVVQIVAQRRRQVFPLLQSGVASMPVSELRRDGVDLSKLVAGGLEGAWTVTTTAAHSKLALVRTFSLSLDSTTSKHTQQCQDLDANCEVWAAAGYCDKEAAVMHTQCARACDVCDRQL